MTDMTASPTQFVARIRILEYEIKASSQDTAFDFVGMFERLGR